MPSTDTKDYVALVAELKRRIADARLRAALSVNRELILLYWGIGRDILSRQNSEGWGTKVIDRLAIDLGRAFPEMTGLRVMNEASQGVEIDPSAAEHAISVGTAFLAELIDQSH